MHNHFFIAFFERSGSTMLVDLLNQHPQISCKMERFDTKNLSSGRQVRELNMKESLQALHFFKESRFKIFNHNKIKGFKFKYPNQLDQYPEVYAYLKKHQFKCIFLIRQNLLKAAVSHQYHKIIKEITGNSNVRQKVAIEQPELGTLNAINYMKMRERQTERFVKMINADFKTVKFVYYEDLLHHKQETLNEIFTFLEIEPVVIQPSKYFKIVDNDLKNAIKNYRWVHHILNRTIYSNYFYKDAITNDDVINTRKRLMQFYSEASIQLHPAPNKKTYFHRLQQPLNLSNDEVFIFRKLAAYYHNLLNKEKHNQYRKNMFNKIKQLELQLFLGEGKYKKKWEYDHNISTV